MENIGIKKILLNANKLLSDKKYIQASEILKIALRRNPYSEELLNLLAITEARIGNLENSYDLFVQLNKITKNLSYKYNLVNVMVRLEMYVDAYPIMKSIANKLPQNPKYLRDAGILAQKIGSYNDSRKFLLRAISLDKNDYDAKFSLSSILLRNGELAEGWSLYEFRFHSKNYPNEISVACKGIASGQIPRYSGEDLSNKSFLIHDEQGYGDFIQFIRYCNNLIDRYENLKITVVCKIPLKKIVKKMHPDIFVYCHGEEDVNNHHYDFWDFVMSLPKYFETNFQDLSKNPYLIFDTCLTKGVDSFLSKSKLNIGLSITGSKSHSNDKYRSIHDVDIIKPIISIKEINFLYLDLEETHPKLLEFNSEIKICRPIVEDFYDTLSIIKRLDLVISVDTSLVHLAGASNVPCWVMLPFISSDWRWGNNLETSPWYDSIRIFKQSKPNDWRGTINKIKKELLKLVNKN